MAGETPAATATDSLQQTVENTRRHLLSERCPAGHWQGRLATSALSTATASAALALIDAEKHDALVRNGLDWLAGNINDDGGWGDTTLSKSNLNTTALCWAAFAMAPEEKPAWSRAVDRCRRWLIERTGSLEPQPFVEAILAFYGRDRTFSVPILTLLSLTGRLGERTDALRRLPQLPFELAAAPAGMWRFLRLPVVSYALPALVAIGQARHHYVPSRCPVKRRIRNALRARTLKVVRRMQATSGGFLEAIPLTSFVAACLTSIGHRGHTIVREAERFLTDLVRDDGGWPIDTCLSTWVTTLSVGALESSGRLDDLLPAGERKPILRWLLDQQYDYVHPFTNTPPGGWSWMDTDGAVPDADDTPGALLAIRHLGGDSPDVRKAAAAGVQWLLSLQNRDGGVPTFCRGWGKLPFDRSAQDMTAHTLRAWICWREDMPPEIRRKLDRAIPRAVRFLERMQRPDGTWLGLWFGNEHAPDDENPTYGTSRVLTALLETRLGRDASVARGLRWLLNSQGDDGGWGGGPNTPASIEETGLAVDALATALLAGRDIPGVGEADLRRAAGLGAQWLARATEGGTRFPPAPIGFYFAKLWYFERLYPVTFAATGLEKTRRALG